MGSVAARWHNIYSPSWMFFLELATVLLGVLMFGPHLQQSRIIWNTDNQGVFYGLQHWKSSSMLADLILNAIYLHCKAWGIIISPVLLPSKLNPADPGSRIWQTQEAPNISTFDSALSLILYEINTLMQSWNHSCHSMTFSQVEQHSNANQEPLSGWTASLNGHRGLEGLSALMYSLVAVDDRKATCSYSEICRPVISNF